MWHIIYINRLSTQQENRCDSALGDIVLLSIYISIKCQLYTEILLDSVKIFIRDVNACLRFKPYVYDCEWKSNIILFGVKNVYQERSEQKDADKFKSMKKANSYNACIVEIYVSLQRT